MTAPTPAEAMRAVLERYTIVRHNLDSAVTDQDRGYSIVFTGTASNCQRYIDDLAVEAAAGLAFSVVDAARAYRDREADDTPRMWRGKELHDLGQALSQAIEAFDEFFNPAPPTAAEGAA